MTYYDHHRTSRGIIVGLAISLPFWMVALCWWIG